VAFTPLTVAPSDLAGPDRWYVVRAGELLLLGPPPGAFPDRPPDPGSEGEPVFVGVDNGVACWACGVPAETDPPPDGRWVPLRRLATALPEAAWAVAGRAVQLVEWQRTSRYCGRCGTATVSVPGERATRCPACGLLAYPRLAPAVIVLVRRGRRALLARNARFPGTMHSTLAGFVELGETLEDAVRREVGEEVGVQLGELRYVGSQPWPFPHSLMVGFDADWASGEIRVDGDEIAEAAWFAPEELPELPPPVSIARHLIDRWLADAT
jgi:NAD+ diphosphatase